MGLAAARLMAARRQQRGWAFFNENRGKFEVPLDPWHAAQLRQFASHRRLTTLAIRG